MSDRALREAQRSGDPERVFGELHRQGLLHPTHLDLLAHLAFAPALEVLGLDPDEYWATRSIGGFAKFTGMNYEERVRVKSTQWALDLPRAEGTVTGSDGREVELDRWVIVTVQIGVWDALATNASSYLAVVRDWLKDPTVAQGDEISGSRLQTGFTPWWLQDTLGAITGAYSPTILRNRLARTLGHYQRGALDHSRIYERLLGLAG